jgi:hypothetical protein
LRATVPKRFFETIRTDRSNGAETERNTMLGLSEAAAEVGVAKSTIFRAIKVGRLSASRRDDGSYEIDGAELFRVYPSAQRSSNGASKRDAPAVEQPATALETEIRMLRELLDEVRGDRDTLRTDRDAWRSQAERLTLAAPTPPPAPTPLEILPVPMTRSRPGPFGLFRRRAA